MSFLIFMEYLTATTDNVAEKTKSERIKCIHKQVKKIKLSEKMGVRYMQRWEALIYARQGGMAVGEAKGETLHLIKMICKKLAKHKTPEEIADELEEDMETVLRICELAEEFAPEYKIEKVWEKYKENFFPETDPDGDEAIYNLI